ncbi:MAG: hypothetical protein KDB79_09175 [Acidobacteria bacterium]|nr:hypothetical protein [Acidobacteriota bacterium]
MQKVLAMVLFGILAGVGFANPGKYPIGASGRGPFKMKSVSSASELAQKALEAHGGKLYKEMKTLSISGSVDVTASMINQPIPATFLTIFSGDKYRIEINNPFQPLKQSFDGIETYSSLGQGFTLPPINRLGLPMLQKLGDDGYVVSELEDAKKNGFRLTSPDGYFTDFYLDKKTNLVKGYDSTYVVNNRKVVTAVEIDKNLEKNGIVIPQKYAQRFDMGQMTVYAEFKAKEILVNIEIEPGVFRLN